MNYQTQLDMDDISQEVSDLFGYKIPGPWLYAEIETWFLGSKWSQKYQLEDIDYANYGINLALLPKTIEVTFSIDTKTGTVLKCRKK